MKKGTFALAAVLLLGAQSQAQQQPVPYSHKTHLALGLECSSCHKNADPGDYMGLPSASFCMSCHQAIKTDSPHIQKIAAAAKDGTPIEWVRVYELPKFVYFSHRVHTKAGATCETCHGAVRELDVMTKQVEHNMQTCMACHSAANASTDCGTCHADNF